MKKNIKNKKGFTLIELIVVIGILAVLAMILVPMVSGYMSKSKQAVADANARSCYSAYQSYTTMKESGLIPAGATENTELAALGWTDKCDKSDAATGVIKYNLETGVVGTYKFKS